MRPCCRWIATSPTSTHLAALYKDVWPSHCFSRSSSKVAAPRGKYIIFYCSNSASASSFHAPTRDEPYRSLPAFIAHTLSCQLQKWEAAELQVTDPRHVCTVTRSVLLVRIIKQIQTNEDKSTRCRAGKQNTTTRKCRLSLQSRCVFRFSAIKVTNGPLKRQESKKNKAL